MSRYKEHYSGRNLTENEHYTRIMGYKDSELIFHSNGAVGVRIATHVVPEHYLCILSEWRYHAGNGEFYKSPVPGPMQLEPKIYWDLYFDDFLETELKRRWAAIEEKLDRRKHK